MDNIKNPPHYANSEIEPIDYIIKNKLTYCEGNVVKYITRWRKKGGIDDLKKAKQYICLLYTSPSPRDQRGSRLPS